MAIVPIMSVGETHLGPFRSIYVWFGEINARSRKPRLLIDYIARLKVKTADFGNLAD